MRTHTRICNTNLPFGGIKEVELENILSRELMARVILGSSLKPAEALTEKESVFSLRRHLIQQPSSGDGALGYGRTAISL